MRNRCPQGMGIICIIFPLKFDNGAAFRHRYKIVPWTGGARNHTAKDSGRCASEVETKGVAG